MNLETQLLFFFSSLGVFNGFLMSLYFLLVVKTKRTQHLFFGLLILMLSIRIGKSVLHFFVDDLHPLILQIGLSACFFIGPFLFFYIRSVLQAQERVRRSTLWHLLSLSAVIVTVGILYPYPLRPDLWNPEIVQGIYAVWLLYVLVAAYQLREVIGKFFFSRVDLSVVQKWLLIVFAMNALICLVFNSVLYFGFPSYILGPITFSLVFYGLAAFLIFFPNSKLIIEGEKQRYANKKVATQKAKKIEIELRRLMLENRLFEQPELKLKDVAKSLQITPHLLSQVLNDNLGRNFSDFVNEYRIDAACKLLHTAHHLTVEGIGKEVGFRSRSSFYAAFKKRHGITPNQFAKQLSN